MKPPEAAAQVSLTRFSSRPEEVVGRVIDGRYVVDRVLGQGAMAVVLGARHLFLDTPVAVKILHPALTAVTEMRERFLREARVTSGVAHDGLVRVSDFGVSPEGMHYLVMEQLEGEDLLSWSQRQGRLGAGACAAIAIQVCDVLAALHAAGYVHRDLKPENLWVVPGGSIGGHRIKVLDLGIAGLIESTNDGRLGRKAQRAEDDAARLTRAGQTLGTPLYMSPEQALGNPLDQRSDLYALGCVLWELATDRCAFEGGTLMDILLKQVSEVPALPSSVNPELPPWFDALIMRLLEKKPEDRFQSAAEAGRAFAEASAASVNANVNLAADGGAAGDAAERREARASDGEQGVTDARLPLDAVGRDAHVSGTATTGLQRAARAGRARVPKALVAITVVAVAVAIALVLLVGRDPGGAPSAESARAVARVGSLPVAPPAWTQAAEAPRVETGPIDDAAVAPEQLSIAFAVDPEGTLVSRAGQPVGVSPFVLTVPRGTPPATYVLSAEGRNNMEVELMHDRSEVVQRTLARAAKRSAGGPAGPGGPGEPVDAAKDTTPVTKTGKTDGNDGLWQPTRPPPGPR